MNKRVLLLILASLTSNLVGRNFVNHSCLGPHYESWIGSSALSAAVAVCFASFVIIPQQEDDITLAILYTYYTVVSVVVSVIVLKLVWEPVVELMTEFNMILSKTILYINRVGSPYMKCSCMKDVGMFLRTKSAVVWSTNLLGVLLLYSVSTDILKYMALYFYTLPRKGVLARMRSTALKAIDTLLYMMSPKKQVRFHWESEIKYYSPYLNCKTLGQCYGDDENDL